MAGFLVTGAAGLLSLVAGSVPLLALTGGLWAATGIWGRTGIAFVVLAIAQWVLFPMSSAVFAADRVPTPLPERTPSDVGLECRDLTLTTGNGVTLAGWHLPSTNGAALALLQGSRPTRADVIDHAEVLAGGGYGVLLPDARGHG